MSNVKIELNSPNIRKFLKSREMRELVKSYADKAADRLGEGYESDHKYMSSRVIASVYTDTPEARRENLENNSILKAVLESGDR